MNPLVPVDSRFATYPSTSSANDNPNTTVLLPGSATEGSARYVLGPAGLTGASIKSASAQPVNGQWMVSVVLTDEGATRWDALAASQFHAVVGVVLNGEVVSAPITQPTQSTFTSFHGQLQISGGFTEGQARAIAAELG